MLLRRAARLLVASLLAAVTSACQKPLQSNECEALLDRYVVLLAHSDRPGTPEGEILKLRAQAREKSATDPNFRACQERVSRKQFECAIQADTTDRFEQCML